MSRPTSSVSGLASGIDWETTVQQLLSIERRRAVLLENRKDENDTKLSLWAQIQSKLAALQSSAERSDRRAEFAVKAATTSDSAVVNVSVDATAETGAHSVRVRQLAKAHKIASQGWIDKNATGITDSGGDFVLTINGETLTINDADLASTTTLEQFASLINNDSENDGKVTATILDDGSAGNPFRLVLTSGNTGADNTITVSTNPTGLNFSSAVIDAVEHETDWSGTSTATASGTYTGAANKTFSFTVDGSGAQTIGAADILLNWVDSAGGSGTITVPSGYSGTAIAVGTEGLQVTFAAGTLVADQSFDIDVFTPELAAGQDAVVQVDGIYMNRSSNTVTDVVQGLTLNLLSVNLDTDIEIAVNNDNAAVKARIQDFVNAYNSLVGDLGTFSRYDEKNEVAAPLLGDGNLSTIRLRMSGVASRAYAGLPESARYDSLAVAGIRISTNGLLSIDSGDLDDALENHFEDVIELFTQTFSSSDSKLQFVSDTAATVAGEYTVVVNYDAAGTATSATINGQSALVEGSLIRGAEDGELEGLVLGWTPATGGPGSITSTIRYGKGAIGEVFAEASRLADPLTGPTHYAQEALNDTNESLDRQIEAWDTRLLLVEERLRRQFANLETALSQMRSQSNFLSGALG
jgi:flagellar hook-associated protein 2